MLLVDIFAVSRARRFGKSMVAGMIKAYYSLGCDSKDMFSAFMIADDPDFEVHLNQYHVLHFDMATFLNQARGDENPIDQIRAKNYAGKLADYGGEILLVGIKYDKDEKEYSCKIEKI